MTTDTLRRRSYAQGPLACVIGGIDVVRPLGLAGIRSAVVGAPGSPALYSRYASEVLDSRRPPKELVQSLLEFARRQPRRPLLFYAADWNLRLVSQFRDRLQEGFHFVLPDAELVENVLDKSRFQELAAKLDLPVPPGQALFPGSGSSPADVRLEFPLLLKPLLRENTVWAPIANTKALVLKSRSELEALWPRLEALRLDVLVQEMIEGPESRIESYHVYIDNDGDFAAEFTGRKLRTYPREFGYSSAVTITHDLDVIDVGRRISAKLGLRGVAKLDFKRGLDGELFLLEVNPRFNLWHHPGARAGVNLPELVYCDLAGLPRPRKRPLRTGVCWCSPRHDLQAARSDGLGLVRWLGWTLRCEIKKPFSWRDPLPLIGSLAWSLFHSGPLARKSHRVFDRRRGTQAEGSGDAAPRTPSMPN